MKTYIISLFLFLSATVWGQNAFEINLSITDSVLILKENRKNNQYAVKVNVEINVPNLQDTLFLYFFKKYVPTISFNDRDPFDYYKNSVIGLNFIVEDKNEYIMISKGMSLPPPLRTRAFVTSKLKIKYKALNDFKIRNYDLAKYIITNEKQSLILYPLLGEYLNLSKGEYYLYFVYAFNAPDTSGKDNGKRFIGNFVSNKVKLIVK